jgi:hypothetical protein
MTPWSKDEQAIENPAGHIGNHKSASAADKGVNGPARFVDRRKFKFQKSHDNIRFGEAWKTEPPQGEEYGDVDSSGHTAAYSVLYELYYQSAGSFSEDHL